MNMSFIWNDRLIAIQFQYQSTWYHKTSSACVPFYSLYSQWKITAHINNNTDPLIIPRLMSHMTHWVHRNPNYIVSMSFIWNGGLENTQYQYQSTWYINTSSVGVPSYSLYSHSNITAHTNKKTALSIIHRLKSHMTHWKHHNPNYIINMHFIWNSGLEAT